jgi:hypothetical protein
MSRVNEIAFTASPESQLYKNYFMQKNETKKFWLMAVDFMHKYFPGGNRHFYLDDTLHVSLSAEESKTFAKQLIKNRDAHENCVFRRNSLMDKAWVSEVCKKVNRKDFKANDLWFLNFSGDDSCYSWSASLWDDTDGHVYGIIGNDGKIYLPEGVTEIKMSEYYAIIEKLEEEGKVQRRSVGTR